MKTKFLLGATGVIVSIVFVVLASGLPAPERLEAQQKSSLPPRVMSKSRDKSYDPRKGIDKGYTAEEIGRMKADDPNVPARIEDSIHQLLVQKEIAIQQSNRQKKSLEVELAVKMAAIDHEILELERLQSGEAPRAQKAPNVERQLEEILARLERIQLQLEMQTERLQRLESKMQAQRPHRQKMPDKGP